MIDVKIAKLAVDITDYLHGRGFLKPGCGGGETAIDIAQFIANWTQSERLELMRLKKLEALEAVE